MGRLKGVAAALVLAVFSGCSDQCGVRGDDVWKGVNYGACALGSIPSCRDLKGGPLVMCLIDAAWGCANTIGIAERLSQGAEIDGTNAIGSEAMVVGERAVCSREQVELCVAALPPCPPDDAGCAADLAGRCLATGCAP